MSTSRRSAEWFGAFGRAGMHARSWLKNQGYTDDVFDGRPVIGIATTWSELAPCNAHQQRIAESVKQGVWQAGGFPLEFPNMALGETLMRPTAMLYRNLLAMQAEETIRANPLDGLVLLSGCDKTTPGLLMGAASVDLPTVVLTGGPMLNGKYRGGEIGSGTAVWQAENDLVAGRITQQECYFLEGCMSRSNGHCMTMGTASTMASIVEALGMQLPGAAAWPAVDARRYATAQRTGQRIVDMVGDDLKPSDLLTRTAFDNAVRVNAAIGGSTNAAIHLIAIAHRVGVDLGVDDFDRLARDVPTLVNLMPSGEYLMEDFCYAGGVPAVMRELDDLLDTTARTVTGTTIAENIADAEVHDRRVITPRSEPFQPDGSGTAVLRGSLAPDGAVVKQSAAAPRLLQHKGAAVVFDDVDDYYAVCRDDDLDVDENSVLVVRNLGPKGFPGMPELANVPVPKKVQDRGFDDIVRISDGRMSGTAYGTVVLHVTPESAAGGPLAFVRTGDPVVIDVPGRTLDLEVPAEELERRRAEWRAPENPYPRGYQRLYWDHVMQASDGADLDFLLGGSGSYVPRDGH
ncbi:IlvD/Edd family dehydratase [Bounagaea algeriensis]